MQVKSTIERYRMFEEGEMLLVAVSGGVDSVVLLDVLQHLAPDYALGLSVAHINHGLRGSASAEDARFVERMAQHRGLPFRYAEVDPTALTAHNGQGLEGAAREVRRSLLQRLAAEAGASKIALGHTANDHAETVLYHLARGAGGAGLSGIPPVALPFVRPLIERSRAEVLAHAQEQGLAWREDATNADLQYTRNRIRHRVMPELERINPKAVHAIGRAAGLIAELQEVCSHAVDGLWQTVVLRRDAEQTVLRRGILVGFSPGEQRLLLREALRQTRGNLVGIEQKHIEAVRKLATSERAHGDLCLPHLHVRIQNNEIRLSPHRPESPAAWSVPIGLGRTSIPPSRLMFELSLASPDEIRWERACDRWSEFADADRVEFPLHLRTRRDGDRFTPLGLGKVMKLKDFLINERIPHDERDRLPLLCDQEKVIWVVGVRLSDEVRLAADTRRVLTMHAEDSP